MCNYSLFQRCLYLLAKIVFPSVLDVTAVPAWVFYSAINIEFDLDVPVTAVPKVPILLVKIVFLTVLDATTVPEGYIL